MMLAVALCAVLLAGFGWGIVGNGKAFAASTFSDVNNGDWYRPYVMELTENGIISGFPDGTFRPSGQVTTGQFLSMVIQTGFQNGILAEPVGMERKEGHWARSFYDLALSEGLLFDDELPASSLDRPISRQWMAVITSRLMGRGLEMYRIPSKEEYEEVLDSVRDVEELSSYSYEIVTAYSSGLLSGYPDGTFRPEEYLSRAEAAAVIYKLNSSEGTTGVEIKPDSEWVDMYCGYDAEPSDMVKGTRMFWYILPMGEDEQRSSSEIRENLSEVKELMKRYTPGLEEELYLSFLDFTEKALEYQKQGKQGLRKEYAGGYPVLMEAVSGEIHVYVKPKGTETRFWGVEPGQRSEEFF